MKVDDATVAAFRELYKGREDAWGSIEGKSNKEAVTNEHYKKHLQGEQSLGVYPLFDDGTCWFFVIDLDVKDFNKAKAIREEFRKTQIPVYISESKKKGFHISGFAKDQPFIAKDIRNICHHILHTLGIPAETFPKQDYLDEVIPLGNYINLPCFGATRSFIALDLKTVKVENAVKKINRIPKTTVDTILPVIPEFKLLTPPARTAKVRGKVRGKPPPCIETLVKGVPAGARDVAAFALARHYLDQMYTPDEVYGLLETWDKRNKPPMADPRQLKTKVASAQKGYAFGCGSIKDEPLLVAACVGEEHCVWIKAVSTERKKQGLIIETSFYEDDSYLYEELIQENKPIFAAYNKQTGEISYMKTIEIPGGYSIVPIYSKEITEHVVSLPTMVEEYGDDNALTEEMRKFIEHYVDLPAEDDLTWAIYHILTTWIYDKLNTIGYLRFQGDTGVGKSRGLDVIGKLCYKPMMLAGAVTPAPIYRLIHRFRGTVILEEADFRDTTEKSEVVTILNSGIERFRPVIRCSKDNPDNLEVLPSFGPKVFATRGKFLDPALESRCHNFEMQETDRDDIPAVVGARFYKAQSRLRNKLLLWRFRNREKINPDLAEEINIGAYEPRVKQLAMPFAIAFWGNDELIELLKGWCEKKQWKNIQDRSEGRSGKVVYAMFKLAQEHGQDQVYPQRISEYFTEFFNEDFSYFKVGRVLTEFHVHRNERRDGKSKRNYIIWEPKLMARLRRRYIMDPTEFDNLFQLDLMV